MNLLPKFKLNLLVIKRVRIELICFHLNTSRKMLIRMILYHKINEQPKFTHKLIYFKWGFLCPIHNNLAIVKVGYEMKESEKKAHNERWHGRC